MTDNKIHFAGGNDVGADFFIYNTVSPVSVAVGVWHHIALARNGTAMFLFIDGVSEPLSVVIPIGTNSTFNGTGALWLGAYFNSTGFLNGRMDEIRISKGIARWTADFSPPSGEYFTCN